MHPITVSMDHLRAAFAPLSKVIGHRTTLPALSHLKLERTENRLAITATDLDRYLTFTCQLEPDPITPLGRMLAEIRWKRAAGSILVPRSVLQSAIKSGATEATFAEGEMSYAVTGTTVRIPFDAIAVREFPVTPAASTSSFAEFDAEHRRWLMEAARFSSADATRYVLNGVYLDVSSDAGRFVATDGRRLYVRAAPGLAGLSESCILPSWSVNLLGTAALLAQDWKLGIGKVQVGEGESAELVDYGVLSAGPWNLVTKLIEGNYPNYHQVIPDELSQPPLSLWATVPIGCAAHRILVDLLAKLPPPDGGSPSALLRFHAGHLEVTCASPRSSFAVPNVTSDAPIAIAFDRRFLLDSLSIGPGILRLADSQTPGLYTSGTAINVLMPLRSESPPSIHDPELEAALAPWEGKEVEYDDSSGTVIGGVRSGLRIYARVESHVPGAGRANIPFGQLKLLADKAPMPPTTTKKPKRQLAAA